jgi:hypothetical protein
MRCISKSKPKTRNELLFSGVHRINRPLRLGRDLARGLLASVRAPEARG